MRKPNDLAQKALSQAADEYAKLADIYEMLSDASRRYAVALREGDTDKIVAINGEIESLNPTETTERIQRAVTHLKMIPSIDSAWYDEIRIKTESRLIEKMSSPDTVMLALLLHEAKCDKEACHVHDMLLARLKELR